MSGLYLNRIELKTEAEYYMRELANAVGQVVFLAIRKDQEVVYVDKIEQFDNLHRFAIIGQKRPFYCTSIGRALLFDQTDDELTEIFASEERIKRTKNTLTEIPDLLERVRQFRIQGYSVDDEEWEIGTMCVGAPIYDYKNKVVAAISLVWNCQQNDLDVPELGNHIRQTALKISSRLGYVTDEVDLSLIGA